jgi:pimeloyl-ACP methyl ester carboxylesterase
MFERMTRPAAVVVRAATRPSTYTGHVREATSTALTSALWPLGLADRALNDADAERVATESAVTTPVLLVHGFGANKSNWLFVKRYLLQAGFGRVDALNYNPFAHDIPALAAQCIERAEALRARYGVERIHLIGHSLGGIIVRYAVQVEAYEGVPVAATVSSPHGGNGIADLAAAGARRGMWLPGAGVQLASDSPVMRRLRETARPLRTHLVAYYSNLDLIVPARRAMIREPELGATNILVKDHGHLSIMLSRRLATSVVAQLGAAEGLPGYGAPITAIPQRGGSETDRRRPPVEEHRTARRAAGA